ncbi:MAG: RimK family alpha-L-glutamate ligase [Planctomycetes bacterium]|nr:RimK family alpha-L-glutamate ligase [Planctomycetota bacterium]
MRLLILSRRRAFYSTHRLLEEADALGHEALVVDPLKCVIFLADGRPRLLYRRRDVPRPDAVIPRIGTYAIGYSLAVVRQLGLMGVSCVNDHGPIARTRNKLACLQVLSEHGVRVPDTLMSRYPRDLKKFIELLGGTPIIMKLLRGTQGTGVMIADSEASVESMLETLWSLGEDIMLQRFVSEAKGRDVRALVIDGKVRSAMRRIGREGEFRSNIHRGGVGEKLRLAPEYEHAAVQAAESCGLKVAGVDILESAQGPMVIEVNSSPGFQGLEAATGQNVARMIVEYALRIARRKS